MVTDHPKLAEALEKLTSGVEVNFGGSSVPAAKLADAIRRASKGEVRPIVLTLINAAVTGHLNLNGLGQDDVRITLQLRNCQLSGGISARSSRWRMLLIHGSRLKFIELPKAQLDDLVIEDSQIDDGLMAIEIDVANTMAISNSRFGDGRVESPVQLREARIGRSVRASNVTCIGLFACAGARIDGELRLGGSVLGDAKTGAHALDLSGTQVTGAVDLCASEKRRFEAHGSLKITNATFGTLAVLGAGLDGGGDPAIIADGLVVASSVILGSTHGHDLAVDGTMRFILARIGGQFQLTHAELKSSEPRCLTLDSAQVEGDIMIGHPDGPVQMNRACSADSIKCGGKVVLTNVSADATQTEEGSAISVRHSAVQGPLLLRHARLRGCLNIDHSHFDGVSLLDVEVHRSKPAPDVSGLPEKYAHEDDALISAIYSTIEADLHCDGIRLTGGDFRLAGVHVKGVVSMIGLRIVDCRTHALFLQGARIDGGVMISGTANEPAIFHGAITLIGAQLGSSLTISYSVVGATEAPAELSLDSSHVAGDVVMHASQVFGRFGVGAATIKSDLRVEGALLVNPGGTALDGRGAIVEGKINFAAVTTNDGATTLSCIVGEADFDGARAGAMRWAGLALGANTSLDVTDVTIERSLEALMLTAAEGAQINLAGTHAASLVDRVGEDEDGWGAGKAKLGLDTFRYDRLILTSGRKEHWPSTIRYWRKIWLGRREDMSSTQAARQLSRVLHDQGLHEASRLVLIDAFSEEAKHAQTRWVMLLQWMFGVFFGHGLSGGRAFATVLALWLIGVVGVVYLQSNDLVVSKEHPMTACAGVDPSLYAADILLPVVDLQQEERCLVGGAGQTNASASSFQARWFGHQFDLFGFTAVVNYLLAIYRILGWIVFSLAIATWSGIFKRTGRGV